MSREVEKGNTGKSELTFFSLLLSPFSFLLSPFSFLLFPFFLLSTFSFLPSAHAQAAATDTTHTYIYRSNWQAGLDIGYGFGSNSEKGPGLALSYRTSLGSVDLSGILFQRWFNNDVYSLGHFGFGFGFLIYKPRLVSFGSSDVTIEPFVGIDFTVWTSTLGIGIPLGAELHVPLVPSLDAALGLSFEPQFNPNSVQNTRIFDVRAGIRYH
ncbi:MAG TPA: hypothetical protein VEW28_02575 [Candidatus Kapabacteria bacterium]|nr:hypothetical protein [Candidatus Kapabacteria bacterium]